MTIINNGDRFIQVSLSNTIITNKITTKCTTYTPELPKIDCSNESDAIRIQEEINTFTNKLIKNLLK